jgi:hypothetical protein
LGTSTRLLKLQNDFVTPIVEGFNDRTKDKPVARWLRDIFYYRRMRLEKTLAPNLLLETWIYHAFDLLCVDFPPEVGPFTVKTGAMAVRKFVF